MDNQSLPTPPSSSSSHWLLIVLCGFLTVLIIGGVFYYVSESKQSVNDQMNDLNPLLSSNNEKTKNGWIKPKSSKKGFPVTTRTLTPEQVKYELHLYSFATKQLENTGKVVDGGSSSAGIGIADPLPSPDLLYTAYINKSDGKVWIMSNETLLAQPIEQSIGASFITAWSPDSKKIIFNVNKDTISLRGQGPMAPYPTGTVSFNPRLDSGYFVFDLDTGINKKLYPVEYIETFIDNNRLLVRTEDNTGNLHNKLIVFNIDTFEADFGYIKEEFPFGSHQFNIAPDGTKWTYTLSRNPTEDSNIIYTNFPNKEGEVIDTGRWADVQFPIISPDGSKIIYAKREGYISPGLPKTVIWSYDAVTKQKKRHIEGWPSMWVDNNNFIVRYQHDSVDNNSYYLVDLNTNASIKLTN